MYFAIFHKFRFIRLSTLYFSRYDNRVLPFVPFLDWFSKTKIRIFLEIKVIFQKYKNAKIRKRKKLPVENMVYANQQAYDDAITVSTNAGQSGSFIDFMLNEIYKTLKE